MQLSFNCGYPVATTNFKMHGQANRIYAILHLMKQILISIHINRELYALRFELIFFFCSKNLRLFLISQDSYRFVWSLPFALCLHLETSAAHVYTGTA